MGDGAQVLRHGSLFSGIGGFDLAADWMGWDNIFHCELDPFCRQLLNYYYPKAQSYGDIKETDFSSYKGGIDILTGGFPCQPYSTAGKRLGKEDPRHLWPDMLRAIREIQPSWVVGENVRGLVSWNGGMVFHEVQSDLEAEGYEVLPFLLPAAGINAPHKRERIWFIAYRGGIGRKEKRRNAEGAKKRTAIRGNLFTQPERSGEIRFATDTGFKRLEGQTGKRIQTGTGRTFGIHDYQFAGIGGIEGWENFPQTQPTVCIGNDGLPGSVDPNSVFEGIAFPVKPITFSKWRTESIRALGNAIVPQMALLIFKTIQELQIKLKMQKP